MANLTQLRIAAREIFANALSAVDAATAVRQVVRRDRSQLTICNSTIDLRGRRIYSIAIGKAALPMAMTFEAICGESFKAGLVAHPIETDSRAALQSKLSKRWHTVNGGHPLPSQQSLEAASAGFDILNRANDERALVVFLISGGGSTMIEWPISEEITLEDLRVANKVLVGSGASISEINAARRAFSAVKGGRLAARAPNCDQVTLIVSDVPKGEERNVASGPSLESSKDSPDPGDVLARHNLRAQLPETIIHAIENPEPLASFAAKRQHFVLLESANAMEAAAQAASQRGFKTEISEDISDQTIEDGCRRLHERLGILRMRCEKQSSDGVCLISGGEFACRVTGDGTGGRNLETSLRLAILNSETPIPQNFVALCAGTDGIDGNSPAAGAIVDSTTIERARKIGLDPQRFLGRSDAYSFFVALGDAITTGLTGTNVRDLRILLSSN